MFSMNFFNRGGLFKTMDINQGVKDYGATPGAVLLDVRTPEEYGEGHIPGSKNIPLQKIQQAESTLGAKERALFVYCHSGARSSQAVRTLQHMGYTNVTNIGGIASYSGKVVR